MGFDNNYVLNIQSIPATYFCPSCGGLVYPHEAFQLGCFHLYCEACLAYIQTTTEVCLHDNCPAVTAQRLVQSDKILADTIGQVVVLCPNYAIGCPWQGSLLDSTAHRSSCPCGGSRVICNYCSTTMHYLESEEHARICSPGAAITNQLLASQTATAIAQGQWYNQYSEPMQHSTANVHPRKSGLGRASSGRQAQEAAFRYFKTLLPDTTVRWVNEVKDTDLPYDLVLKSKNDIEFIKVLSTTSPFRHVIDFPIEHLKWALEHQDVYGVILVLSFNNELRVKVIHEICKKLSGPRNVADPKVHLVVSEDEEPLCNLAAGS